MTTLTSCLAHTQTHTETHTGTHAGTHTLERTLAHTRWRLVSALHIKKRKTGKFLQADAAQGDFCPCPLPLCVLVCDTVLYACLLCNKLFALCPLFCPDPALFPCSLSPPFPVRKSAFNEKKTHLGFYVCVCGLNCLPGFEFTRHTHTKQS